MSPRTRDALLLTILAAALPRPAAALDVSAEAGVSYSRYELQPPGGPSVTRPHLDVDLGLDARGAIVAPDVVDWKLGASYRRLADSLGGTETSRRTLLFYDGAVALFRSPRSAVTIALAGSRRENEFSRALATDVFGHAISDEARATLTLRPRDLPAVNGAYSFRNLEERIPNEPLHVRRTHGIAASAAAGTGSFNYSASYRGELNEGTWDTDDFDLHTVSVQAGAGLPRGLLLNVDERYHRVEPRATGPGTFAQENNSFRAYVHDAGTFGDRHRLEYLYGHAITEAGGEAAERARNAIRYEGDHLLTRPTLFTRWLLDVSYAQSRAVTGEATAETTAEAAGETAGVQLWWRRVGPDRVFEIYGGPLYALIHEKDVVAKEGYGGTLSARLSRPFAGQVGRAGYDAAYGSDLFGLPGWNLRHSLTLGLDGALWTGRYSSYVRGSSVRSYAPLFGDGASRSVEAYASATFRRADFELRGLLDEGMTAATPGEFVGDGLFIPAPFDTSSRQVWLRARFNLLPGLDTRAHFRYAVASRPGQPSIDQTEVIAGLDYHYAALSFSIEDRVDWYEGLGRSNTLSVRVYRRFDVRF